MKHESKHFIFGKDEATEDVGPGIKRQFLGYNEELMVVKVWFDQGAIGPVHNHFHSQVSYVESGSFEVNVDGKKKVLGAGDSFFIPPHIDHGAVCLEAGVLLDVFSPQRKDFLEGEGYYDEN